jgi:hypothetical protein
MLWKNILSLIVLSFAFDRSDSYIQAEDYCPADLTAQNIEYRLNRDDRTRTEHFDKKSSRVETENFDDLEHSKIAKKHHLSICAIFKNEFRHLKEWIEYHRLIGVDHFYLYNIKSLDQSEKILSPYIKEGIVTLVDWIEGAKEDQSFVWMLSTQTSAYENAIILRKYETEWMCFLDVGEFLVPGPSMNLTDLLRKYNDFPGIILSSDFFDVSKLDRTGRTKLLIEAVQLTNTPQIDPHKQVTKMIFKPILFKNSSWAPYQCNFKNDRLPAIVKKREARINYYLNRDPLYLDFGNIKKKLYIDNRLLRENETMELLEEGYAIEDQERAIFQFVPELLQKMEYKSGWEW